MAATITGPWPFLGNFARVHPISPKSFQQLGKVFFLLFLFEVLLFLFETERATNCIDRRLRVLLWLLCGYLHHGPAKEEEKKIECANAKLHRTNISSTEGAYCSLLASSDTLVSVGGARAGLTTETTPPSTSSMASSEWMQSLRLLPSNAGIFVVTVSFFGGFLACFFFDAFTTVLQQKKGKLSGST